MVRVVQEYGEIPLQAGELEIDGRLRIRADVVQRGYVEWRAGVASADKGSRAEVDVTRRLYAKGVVGLVPLAGNLSALVRPRYPASLDHMVSYCDWSPTVLDVLRYYDPNPAVAEDWMLDRIAADLLASVRAVLDQGLLRTYKPRTITTSSPKGRLDIRRTISSQASRGTNYRAVSRYFERTETLPANQAMRAAVEWSRRWFKRRQGESTGAARRQLRSNELQAIQCLHALRFVEDDVVQKFLHDPYVRRAREFPEARTEYRRAMQLAVALLERRGFSLDDGGKGTFGLPTLLIETDLLFEEFVRKVLQHNVTEAVVLDGNLLNPRRPLFESAVVPPDLHVVTVLKPGSNNVSPDILIERNGTTKLVIDVKYKRVASGHAERKDVEQVVTYAQRLGCTEAVTVHPCATGQTSGLVLSGRVGGVRVWQYRVSLGTDISASSLDMAATLDALSRVSDDAKAVAIH